MHGVLRDLCEQRELLIVRADLAVREDLAVRSSGAAKNDVAHEEAVVSDVTSGVTQDATAETSRHAATCCRLADASEMMAA